MREFINIISQSFKSKLNESSAKGSLLREFANDDSVSLEPATVVNQLQQYLGQTLYRVGGKTRVYKIDGGGTGIVYVVGNSTTAIGISWLNSNLGVSRIYVWYNFSINRAPDYCIDLPKTVSFDMLAPQVAQMIVKPIKGKVPVNESVIMEARRVSDGEFITMAQQWAAANKKDASRLSIVDLGRVSTSNDVQMPQTVRLNKQLKVGPDEWNLSGGTVSGEEEKKINTALGKALGGEFDEAPPTGDDPDHDNLVNLAQIKTVNTMAKKGNIWLAGRNANGKFFRVPNMETLMAQLERLLTRELAAKNSDDPDKTSMEIQYENLESKVELIASGKSNFLKSLLITGSPSSGKTFNVMQTIKRLGLEEGDDYIVKKGYISISAMFRVLIEQCNGGLILFDDCDSVLTNGPRAVNMLKGALDTDPVREISNDVKGTVNTAVMRPATRDDYVFRLSELLRGAVPTVEDAEFFAPYARIKKSKKKNNSDEDDNGEDEEEVVATASSSLSDDQVAVIDYVCNHLPNKIDFKGRVIFISNLNEEDWDSAILSRAFTINLSFDSAEMLDFFDKIKDKIDAPGLSEEDKAEVIDYIRELYTIGKIKAAINFRLVFQAFDLRLTPNWKRLVREL